MKRACITGWPVEHSRSPMIHGHWIAKHGIDGSYTRRAVPPEEAEAFYGNFAAHGFVGCNVTAPNKEVAFRSATEREASAVATGAANTLWLEGGRLHCANSDTYGFMTNLERSAPGWRRRDAPVTLVGAGGSARTIAFGFLEAGVGEVRIVNRTPARAEAIAAHFGPRVKAFGWEHLGEATRAASVVVNTTTLGMAKGPPLDLDVGLLCDDCVVADIVYVPLETGLLRRARERGLIGVDGLGMLLHQAVPPFERWFGVRPDVTAELRNLIVADIEGR